MESNTTVSIKVYLMAILDNYMFRPLLAIFRLSSRELKFLLYTLCGDRGSTVVKVLCYKSEGRWFDHSWCQWIFH